MNQINKSSRITLHFELALDDNQIVDSNFDGVPAEFTFGDGNLLPGFEEALLGLSEGEEKTLLIEPENAFGAHNPSNIQRLSRGQFEMELEEGMIVSFADKGNNELPGVIAKVEDHEVMVDFNHPLAGRRLQFRVKIVKVVDA